MFGESASPVVLLDRHTQIRQLADFASSIRAVAFFFGIVALGAAAAWRDGPMLATAVVALGYAICASSALQQLAANQSARAVLLIAGGIIAGETILIVFQPALSQTLAIVSLIPLWVAHQYARNSMRRALMATSIVAAVIVVIVGRFHAVSTQVPDWFLASFQISSAFAVMALCLIPSMQWQSRLRLRIAQQQDTQNTLEQETARWKAMLLSQHDAVICTDDKGEVIQMNAAAERLTGWTLDAVRGRHIEDVFCVETEDLERAAEDFIEKVLTSKQGFAESQSVRLAAKSGKIWHVAASAAPITLDGGGIIGVIFTFKDMTERMLDIERAQALERMHTVERLAAGVAKDFNEAVTEIGIHSQKVLEKLVVGELPAWEDAAAVVKTNERAQRLVRHLLVIGQGQHAKASIIEVADFIGATADLLSRTLGPDIFVKGRHQVYVWPIRADAGMLQEALAELAHYGRDVMRTGGTLVLEAANEYVEESRGPQRGPTAPGAYVKIVLRDASGGVEEGDVLRVLEPYFKPRLRQQEATIKLAVAHGLVRQNRGFLAVTSEMRYGCAFEMYFPRAEPDSLLGTGVDNEEKSAIRPDVPGARNP
jgi:PAS domain S-box-containing protein